jgi:hypothetical protein
MEGESAQELTKERVQAALVIAAGASVTNVFISGAPMSDLFTFRGPLGIVVGAFAAFNITKLIVKQDSNRQLGTGFALTMAAIFVGGPLVTHFGGGTSWTDAVTMAGGSVAATAIAGRFFGTGQIHLN